MKCAILVLVAVVALQPLCFAETITFDLQVDDFGIFSIDGSVVGSYDNPLASGTIVATLDLTPGWHDISIQYENREGTNFLALSQQYPSDLEDSIVPLEALRSFDQNGQLISGLHADYYDVLGGTKQFTIYGEGPINNGALSFTDERYEGNPGLWAGVYGPSALFAEVLTGQIDIVGTTPEPSSALLLLTGAGLVYARRTRLRSCRKNKES